MHNRLIYFLLAFVFLFCPQAIYSDTTKPTETETQTLSPLRIAKISFEQKNYDRAIHFYRQHLKNHPNDLGSWNELAASYYHFGLPRRALRYLRNTEEKTINKSFNYYYQGLCYHMEKSYGRAEIYFNKAATINDLYGNHALFELAVIYHNMKDINRTKYYLDLYLPKNPRGIRGELARKMQSELQNESLSPVVWPIHPDRDQALYRYNKLSLMNFPHYWIFSTGFDFELKNSQEPLQEPKGAIKQKTEDKQALLLSLGFGLGPMRQGPTYGWMGYTYRQRYLTSSERLKEYIEEPGDFSYQPFRFDLLERTHELYGDVRRSFNEQIFVGLYGKYSTKFIGSNFLGSPDDQALRKVFHIADTVYLIPWIGYQWDLLTRSLFYFYYKKEINQESPEISNMTFNFKDSSISPLNKFSFGLTHSQNFPKIDTDLNLELFHYSFTYNDQWLEYDRWGLLFGGDHRLVRKLTLSAHLGYYVDKYRLDIPKRYGCNPNLSGSNPNSSSPKFCARDDQGFFIESGLFWNLSNFHRLGTRINYVSNTSRLKEYDENKFTFQLYYTIAFPSVARVLRFTDRFKDNIFTKQPE